MKNFFFPIAGLVISVALYFVYINPNYQAAKVSRPTMASLEQTQADATNLDKLEQQVRNKFNTITAGEQAQLNKLLPDSVDTIQLITEINAIASKYGITVKGLQINSSGQSASSQAGTIPQQGPYGILPFSFSITASYKNFLSFLNDLERSLQLIDITNIGISNVTDLNSNYTYNVSAQTYWLK